MDTGHIDVIVEYSHILRGTVKSSHECPIALSLKDQGFEDVKIGKTNAHVDGKNYKLDKECRTFVCLYDLGLGVTPIKARLEENAVWLTTQV